MKERQVDPETPRVPKRDIYILYIQTYNFETVLRDQMPRAKALGNNIFSSSVLVKKLNTQTHFYTKKLRIAVFQFPNDYLDGIVRYH